MVEALVGDVSANVYSASATSALVLTEATGGASNRNRAATSTIVFCHEGYPHLEGQSAIAVADALAYSGTWNRVASSAIALDNRAVVVRTRGASSVLTLAQSLDYVGPRAGLLSRR